MIFIRAGRENEYHGVAVHPKHLSLYERLRGIGKNYNAEVDYKQKIEEMRTEWELSMAKKAEEKRGEELQKLIEEVVNVPPAILEKVRGLYPLN